MRTAIPTQAVEMLLRALYEGTASDRPWVAHNGVAWEMEELTCDGMENAPLAYQTALLTRADERTRALTRETLLAVRAAVDYALTVLDNCECKGRLAAPGRDNDHT